MSGFRRVDIIEPSSSSLRFRETYIFNPRTLIFPSFLEEDEVDFPFCGVLNPRPTSFELSTQCFFPPAPTTPVDVFDSVTDLIHVEKTPILSSYKRIVQNRNATTDFYLRSLSDRVSALELGFDKVLGSKIREQDRKYSWIAEIKTSEKDGVDRKYKWTAEIKGAKKDDEAAAAATAAGVEKNYKWIAEIKGKGKDAPISRTYTFKASTAPAVKKSKESGKTKEKKEEKEEKKCCGTRAVAIEADDQGTIFLKQAFAKRTGAAAKAKGKKKELSPQDAAMMIQVTFRAYLIRRSQALRALRELAVAKTKLKELRVLFNNFSYRRRLFRDAEERQKFSERIIVLLLTVDAIEGVDLMVRVAKKSMVDELEAMLDVVDPQPSGKLGSMKRRKFDLPEGVIQQEIAAGVAEVVQMLDEDKNTFEVCL